MDTAGVVKAVVFFKRDKGVFNREKPIAKPKPNTELYGHTDTKRLTLDD